MEILLRSLPDKHRPTSAGRFRDGRDEKRVHPSGLSHTELRLSAGGFPYSQSSR